MKMARASLKEAEAAVRLANVLEAVAKNHYPPAYDESNNVIDDEAEPIFFDADDVDHLRAFHDRVMDCLDGGLFRVTFGMLVLLDPKNEVVDPDEDALELHPKHVRAEEQRDELLKALKEVVRISDRKHDAWDAAKAAIAKAEQRP